MEQLVPEARRGDPDDFRMDDDPETFGIAVLEDTCSTAMTTPS
jgi:hypothetical protein